MPKLQKDLLQTPQLIHKMTHEHTVCLQETKTCGVKMQITKSFQPKQAVFAKLSTLQCYDIIIKLLHASQRCFFLSETDTNMKGMVIQEHLIKKRHVSEAPS